MTWLLTAKSGSSRGESWAIGPRPMILGRSLSCDITIGDPTVSRKHCEVKLEGDGVLFRDLGSRNVSLVNGRAVETCRLLVGDELSLGTESFILTRTIAPAPPSPVDCDPRSSTTISLDEAIFLRECRDGDTPAPTFPTTVQDLVALFQFGRKLGQSNNVVDFATLCIQEMEEAFPARVSPALCCVGAEGLSWFPSEFKPSDDLLAQVSEAMARGDASMSSYRAKRRFFREVVIAGAAPMMSTGRCLGSLVIQSAARDYIPEPSVLSHLNALAQTASPYLGSIMHRKQGAPADHAAANEQHSVESKPHAWLGNAPHLVLNAIDTGELASLDPLANAERALIGAVLSQCEGNTRVAAEILGLPVSTLEKISSGVEKLKGERR